MSSCHSSATARAEATPASVNTSIVSSERSSTWTPGSSLMRGPEFLRRDGKITVTCSR